MKRFAITNQKGGVGKTATAQNLSAALASPDLEQRVLMVDLDPQAALTTATGERPHELPGTVYDVLHGRASVSDVLRKVGPRLSLLPASLDLAAADVDFAGVPGREYILRDALRPLRGFDYVLIDCPPALGLLTLNALAAVDGVLVPVAADYLSMTALKRLLETVELVRARINRRLELAGIVLTRVDRRRSLSADVERTLRERFGDAVFQTVIREGVALAEAPSHGKDIFIYKPASHGAEDYLALAREILKGEKRAAKKEKEDVGSRV
jgi:chromosome partitioning protein